MPLKRLLKRFKKSKSKNKYEIESFEGDHNQLPVSNADQGLSSSDDSVFNYDEVPCECDSYIRAKSHSTGALHKVPRKLRKWYKSRKSDYESIQVNENVRRCKSESEISSKKTERRPSSLFRSLLCVIAESESQNSDNDVANDNPNIKEDVTLIERSDAAPSLHVLSDEEQMLIKDIYEDGSETSVKALNEIKDAEEETEGKIFLEKSSGGACIKFSKEFNDPEENAIQINWERTGARPKYSSSSKKTATSSGVSSMLEQSDGPLMEEFIKSAKENTPAGRCASSPDVTPNIDDGEENEMPNKGWNSCTNIVSSNVMLNLSDGGAPPVMAVNQATSKSDKDRSKATSGVIIKTFVEEGKVASRLAFQKGMQMLTSNEMSRIAVLVGHKGDGKTISGKYLLNMTKCKHKFIIGSSKEWQQSVKVKEADEPNTVIFIDDIFGTDRFRKNLYDKWAPFLDTIYSACKNGNVSAIIAMDKKVYEHYLSHQVCHSLFCEAHIIDLSEEFGLKRDEKVNIVKEHLKKFKKANEVRFCKEKEEDNTANFVEGEDLIIWEGTVEQIAILPYPVGFPRAASAFASSIGNIKQGIEYFYCPQNSIVVAVNEMRQSQDPYQKKASFAIGALVQSGGQLSISAFDADENLIEPKVKRGHKETRVSNMKTALRKSVPNTEQQTIYLTEGIDEVKGKYINIEDDRIYFRCVPIHYSAAISFGKVFASDVIAVMPFDFVSKFVGPSRAFPDRQALYISLNASAFSVLADRLLQEISKRDVKTVMEHPYFGEMNFVSFFLKHVSSECKMKLLLQTTDKETNLNVLCHGMSRSYQKHPEFSNFTEHILYMKIWKENMKKKTTMKEYFEKEAVKIAATEKKVSSFKALVKVMKTFDDKCFDAVIQSGSKEFLDILLKYQNYKIKLCTALKATSRYHSGRDAKTAVKFAQHLLSKESTLMIKKAMRETTKYATETKDDHLLKLLKMLNA